MTDRSAVKSAAENKLPVVWLSPNRTSATIEGPKDSNNWILLNLEYSGYYRVNYDLLGWELLSAQLRRNHTVIPSLNRAQLIDDAFVMGHAGILSYEVAKRLIQYLAQADEKTYIRSVAAGHLNRMEQKMMLQFEITDKLDDKLAVSTFKLLSLFFFQVTKLKEHSGNYQSNEDVHLSAVELNQQRPH